MLPAYTRMQAVVHEISATAASRAVIEPGETTTEDVVWWLRQRVVWLLAASNGHPGRRLWPVAGPGRREFTAASRGALPRILLVSP
jgi:hypothetical protein